MRIAVVEAVGALGLRVETGDAPRGGIPPDAAGGAWTTPVPGTSAPLAAFVSLDSIDGCSACRRADGRAEVAALLGGGILRVGYGTGSGEVLAVHRLHRCADIVLALRAVAGRPRFVQVAAGGLVSRAEVTAREADVLVLLLAGLTTAGIATRLGVAPCTVRSHCRAVLRKFGAGDRRALRARILAGSESTRRVAWDRRAEVCQAPIANFAE
jgi:DNA-binding CsgD family transcriptional regulator